MCSLYELRRSIKSHVQRVRPKWEDLLQHGVSSGILLIVGARSAPSAHNSTLSIVAIRHHRRRRSTVRSTMKERVKSQ